jgi:hypothetical protein
VENITGDLERKTRSSLRMQKTFVWLSVLESGLATLLFMAAWFKGCESSANKARRHEKGIVDLGFCQKERNLQDDYVTFVA